MRSREVHEGFDGPTLGSGAMAAARMRSQSSSPRWPDEGLRTTVPRGLWWKIWWDHGRTEYVTTRHMKALNQASTLSGMSDVAWFMMEETICIYPTPVYARVLEFIISGIRILRLRVDSRAWQIGSGKQDACLLLAWQWCCGKEVCPRLRFVREKMCTK